MAKHIPLHTIVDRHGQEGCIEVMNGPQLRLAGKVWVDTLHRTITIAPGPKLKLTVPVESITGWVLDSRLEPPVQLKCDWGLVTHFCW